MAGDDKGGYIPTSRGYFPVTPKGEPWNDPSMNALQHEVRRLLDDRDLNLNASNWSRAAKLGSTFVRDLLRRSNPSPGAEKLVKLALAAGLSADHFTPFLGSQDSQPGSNAPVRFVDRASIRVESVELPRDVPLLRSEASKSESGDFVMGGASGAYVTRPFRLNGREDVRAAYVQTDKVERYPLGELIYLETLKPPRVGDFAVVEMKEGHQLSLAYLGKVVRMTRATLTLVHSDGDKPFDVLRAAVATLYRVMTIADLLG